MLSSVLIAGTALAGLAAAQYSAPANATAIALLEAEWKAACLDTPCDNGQALGRPVDAQGLLGVRYGETTISTGQAYPADAVANRPTLTLYPKEGGNLSADNSYTLALVDFSSISDPDNTAPAEGQEYRHYLSNSVKLSPNSDGTMSLSNGTVIGYYAGPGPLAGTGPHRYAWLLFQQPSTFTAPANLSQSGVAPSHWDFEAYVSSTGLEGPVAAQFFTVENGAPSVAAYSTSAVNTATLQVSSAASSGASSAAASGSATRGTGTQAEQSGTASAQPTGAASALAAPVTGGLAAVAAIVALFA